MHWRFVVFCPTYCVCLMFGFHKSQHTFTSANYVFHPQCFSVFTCVNQAENGVRTHRNCLSARLSLGDWAGSLALGEMSWPLVFGVAVDLLGSDLVHRYVGCEGYSRHDSPFALTKTGPGPVIPVLPVSFHYCVAISSEFWSLNSRFWPPRHDGFINQCNFLLEQNIQL